MKKGYYLHILLLAGLLAGCGMLPGADEGSQTTESSAASGLGQRAAPNDSAIVSAVQAALKQDDLVADSNVNVASEQGVVTLSGQLPNARAANRAFSVARGTEGVRRVISNLTWLAP